MKLSLEFVIASMLASAIASPVLKTLVGPDPQSLNIQAVLLQDKVTSKVSLTALTGDSSGILGRSCSKSLTSGAFASIPVSFDVDENSAGNITIGSESFAIHGALDDSGRIVCSRVDSEFDSLASCTFSVPSPIQLTPSPVHHEDLAECFSDGGVRVANFLQLPSNGELMRRNTVISREVSSVREASTIQEGVNKRQEECTLWSYYTQRVGDGDPWQSPLHIQLSLNFDCGDGNCRVGRSDSRSYTIGYSASANLFGWISGGFTVEETVETGNNYECEGSHERVCMWKEVGRTAYRVKNMRNNWCFGEVQDGGEFEIVSPNSNTIGSRMYCVRGQYCRGMGERYESARFRGAP